MIRAWFVVAGLFSMSLLTIIDRVSISAAKTDIARDLNIDDVSFGVVFSAFALGYALFQVPSGWLVDRKGPRLFIALIVLAWSICTILTGAATSLAPLIMIRFAFGAFEAGAYPAAAKANYSWLDAQRRGLAQGILMSGSRIGAAVGLGFATWMLDWLGWRGMFGALGVAGVVWASAWYALYRDGPNDARSSARDVDYSLLRHPAIPGLLGQYFASNFTIFLAFTWLFPYLQNQYALTRQEAGLYASIPLFMATGSNWVAGVIMDLLFRLGYHRDSRRWPALGGFVIASGAMVGAAAAPTVNWAVALFSLAMFGADLALSPSWTVAIDIGQQDSGLLSGAMNMAGNLGSFVSSVVFPVLTASAAGAAGYFLVAAALNALAALLWWRMNWAVPERKQG